MPVAVSSASVGQSGSASYGTVVVVSSAVEPVEPVLSVDCVDGAVVSPPESVMLPPPLHAATSASEATTNAARNDRERDRERVRVRISPSPPPR